VSVANPLGIHARPSALVVRKAARFKADIYLSKEDVRRINGKSIMGVMMLAAEQGSQVTIEAVGEDASAAVDALAELLQSDFEAQI
jgi:phosphocarrier protein